MTYTVFPFKFSKKSKLHSFIQSVEQFNSYFKGRSSAAALKNHMEYYDAHREELKRNFHTITLEESHEVTEAIKALFKSLDIAQPGRYFGSKLTLYQLLLELNKDDENKIQVQYLLHLIDQKRKSKKLWYGMGFLATSICIIGILAIPGFSALLGIVQILIASSLSIPLFGSLFNLSWGGYNFYQNQVDRKKNNFNRWRDNLFMFGSGILTIVAYGIWIATATAMTPLIAGLFVAASGLDVLKETVCLIQALYKRKHPVCGGDELSMNRVFARDTNNYKKHRNAAIISLTSAVILLGIMSCWCFLPSSFLITIVAIAAILVVYTTQSLLLKGNEWVMRDNLQSDLKLIDESAKAKKRADRELDVFVSLINSPALENDIPLSRVPFFSPTPQPKVVVNEEKNFEYRS